MSSYANKNLVWRRGQWGTRLPTGRRAWPSPGFKCLCSVHPLTNLSEKVPATSFP